LQFILLQKLGAAVVSEAPESVVAQVVDQPAVHA
jgi:hypothetical protein